MCFSSFNVYHNIKRYDDSIASKIFLPMTVTVLFLQYRQCTIHSPFVFFFDSSLKVHMPQMTTNTLIHYRNWSTNWIKCLSLSLRLIFCNTHSELPLIKKYQRGYHKCCYCCCLGCHLFVELFGINIINSKQDGSLWESLPLDGSQWKGYKPQLPVNWYTSSALCTCWHSLSTFLALSLETRGASALQCVFRSCGSTFSTRVCDQRGPPRSAVEIFSRAYTLHHPDLVYLWKIYIIV